MTVTGAAAPGRLELIRGFVNTRDIEEGVDLLDTGDRASAWLQSLGLLSADETLTTADAGHLRTVREAIRDVLASHHPGTGLSLRTERILNDAIDGARMSITVSEDRWGLEPRAENVNGVVGSLMVVVLDAMTEGTWKRLKSCVNDVCRWAFYDRSPSRTGKWCSMGVCGNRAKQQTWRGRQV